MSDQQPDRRRTIRVAGDPPRHDSVPAILADPAGAARADAAAALEQTLGAAGITDEMHAAGRKVNVMPVVADQQPTGQQHGAIAGRVTGQGNDSTDEPTGPAADLGDPATDLIGTWRLHPDGYQYDLDAPRALRIEHHGANRAWVVVDPAGRYSDTLGKMLTDHDVAGWPYTPTCAVGAAARLHGRAHGLLPEQQPAPSPIVIGDEGDSPFRDRKGSR